MLLILQTRSALLALFCSTLYYSYNKSGLIKKNARKIIGAAIGISVLSYFFLQQLGTFDDFLNEYIPRFTEEDIPENDFSPTLKIVERPITWSVIKYNKIADKIAETKKPL